MNRSMAAKGERARKQRIEAGAREASKFDRDGERIAAKQLAAIAAQARDDLVVKNGATVWAKGLARDVGREGKRRASRTTTCYGDGRRFSRQPSGEAVVWAMRRFATAK